MSVWISISYYIRITWHRKVNNAQGCNTTLWPFFIFNCFQVQYEEYLPLEHTLHTAVIRMEKYGAQHMQKRTVTRMSILTIFILLLDKVRFNDLGSLTPSPAAPGLTWKRWLWHQNSLGDYFDLMSYSSEWMSFKSVVSNSQCTSMRRERARK